METNIIGKTYHLKAAKPDPASRHPFFRYIGLISKESSKSLFGIDPKDVIDVECEIIEQDICMKEYFKKGDIRPTDYFAMYDITEGKIRLIQHNALAFNLCFSCGADASCIDPLTGEQHQSIVRLRVEKEKAKKTQSDKSKPAIPTTSIIENLGTGKSFHQKNQ